MKKIIILVLIVVVILVALLVYGFIDLNNYMNNSDDEQAESGTDGELRSFSFNRSYKNDMDDGPGDSQYYYLSTSKIVLEIWGYDSDIVIEKTIKIDSAEFELLKAKIENLIEKYDIESLADAQSQAESDDEDDIYITDSHSDFSIDIRRYNRDTLSLNTFPDGVNEMVADLNDIFADYID